MNWKSGLSAVVIYVIVLLLLSSSIKLLNGVITEGYSTFILGAALCASCIYIMIKYLDNDKH